MTTHLLIIDPQIDFMDLPGSSLPVTGADADMVRLAAFISARGRDIDAITVTLDTHELLDIGHPGFWLTAAGEHPAPFTQVRLADVRNGKFGPRDPELRDYVLRYLEALEIKDRYTHMIWPVHCQLGGRGHAIHPAVLEAINVWELRSGKRVYRLQKGMNPLTESYSAVRAEVPDVRDPNTSDNMKLIGLFQRHDRTLVAGEALSHCVKATVDHLVELTPRYESRRARRLTLLTDAMSPVGGFEAQGKAFLEGAAAVGATLKTLAEVV